MSNTTIGDPYRDCNSVSAACPVEATVLGYYPDLGANVFFLASFTVFGIAQLFLGIRFKTWTYMTGTVLGCGTEAIGYAGRVLMHNNPWSSAGFNMQITRLVIAPAFLSASIYQTLKHAVIAFGLQYSLLKPRWYAYIFIGVDLISLVLQGAGCGIAATADRGSSTQDLGGNLTLAGVSWQVMTLSAFGLLVLLYAQRLFRARGRWSSNSEGYRRTLAFKLFCWGVFIAYLTIMIRCIYRIPEQAGGWCSPLQRNERDFILEGAVISIAAAAQTSFHPGFGFPQTVQSQKLRYTGVGMKSTDSLEQSQPRGTMHV